MERSTPAKLKTIPRGCSLIELAPQDAENIVLAFSKPELYRTSGNPAFFGETIGRVANRISKARIDNLNGRTYHLPANEDGTTTLHGGNDGWGKKDWHGPVRETRKNGNGTTISDVQKYTHTSPHMDEGFPGTVEARAWWSRWEEEEKFYVELEMEVEMSERQPEGVEETVVALTNHSYFNCSPTCVSSTPSIGGSILQLATTDHLTLDDTNIPTGTIANEVSDDLIVANEPFVLGDHVPQLDHCFLINTHAETVPLDTRSQPLRHMASMMHPKNSVCLEVHSTEPAFQVYTGDGIDVDGGDGMHFGGRTGIAIEPGRYTNAVNRPEWRHMVLLRRGQKWGSRTRYVTYRDHVTETPIRHEFR